MEAQSLFKFGVIADVQYADAPDGFNHPKTRMRYYRNALVALGKAVDHFRAEKVEFVLQLGDVIDGKCRHTAKGSAASMEAVMNEFHRLDCPSYHTIGNHELYNFREPDLARYLGFDERTKLFTQVTNPHPRWKFIGLDSYDLSMMRSDERARVAETMLRERNPLPELNDSTDDWPYFTKYNAAMSPEQLAWLDAQLQEADDDNQLVAIYTHIPILPIRAHPRCLFWNYEEILAVLHRHPSVQMVLCGHNHVGFYQTDDVGIHHLAVQAVLETAPHDDAFAVMEVFEDHIFCRGAGRVPHIKFHLRCTGDARQERLRKNKSSTRASAEKRRRR